MGIYQKKNIENDDAVTYYDLGFGASKKVSKDEIESITIFSKNYWVE